MTATLKAIAVRLIEGNHLEIVPLVETALAEGKSAATVLNDGLLKGMGVVGIRFRDGMWRAYLVSEGEIVVERDKERANKTQCQRVAADHAAARHRVVTETSVASRNAAKQQEVIAGD